MDTIISLGTDAVRHLTPDEWRCTRAEDVPDGAGVVGGYGLRFGTPHVDGYSFPADVDLGPDDGDRRDVSFNHHVPIPAKNLSEATTRELADHRFLPARATRDELGVWLEAVLREADDYERVVDEMVKAGKLGWSPGSAPHTARVRNEVDGSTKDLWWHEAKPGPIVRFPVVEWALTPMPADPRARAVSLRSLYPETTHTPPPIAAAPTPKKSPLSAAENRAMDEEQIEMQQQAIARAVADEMARQKAEADKAAEATRAAAEATKKDEELAALRKQVAEMAGRSTTDWGGSAPAVVDADHVKYDNHTIGELAMMVQVCDTLVRNRFNYDGRPAQRARPSAYNSLAQRLNDSKESNEAINYRHARQWLRMQAAGYRPDRQGRWQPAGRSFDLGAAIRANEIHQSTLANGIDEWIGVAYSGDLWDLVRHRAGVVNRIPNQEFPAGAESLVLPILDGDVTFYNVAQSADLSANPGGIPTNTVTSSQLNSGNRTVTLAKHGARSHWTGEASEDAVLPFVNVLMQNFAESGADHLESAIIDGDVATTTAVNVNDAANTPTTGDFFLAYDGFRNLPLVTNTANARDAGVLTVEDYILTMQLMGTAGIDGMDRQQCFFIVDPSTYYKTCQLTEVKTQDVFSAPTLEGGVLMGLWGYPLYSTANIHKMSTSRRANTSGLVDQATQSNNTTGSIVAVRKDHWRFYWRRRMTMETTRIAAADATEIVALLRTGLTYRDTEAAAISYNITV